MESLKGDFPLGLHVFELESPCQKIVAVLEAIALTGTAYRVNVVVSQEKILEDAVTIVIRVLNSPGNSL